MPLSRDPAKRAVQLANLRRDASVTHGARSESRIRPLRHEHLAELLTEYPNASRKELLILAHRLAQLDLLAEHADRFGVLRDRRKGEPYPAAMLAEKLASSVERQIAALREREERRGAPAGQTLEDVIAELTAEEDGAGDAG